jgi:hypothetical protein
MGIQVEFNPDLALRDISEFENGHRKEEECLPKVLKAQDMHSFLKEGQRNYFLEGEIPLLETKGNQNLSLPKASILILEATHFAENGKIYTKGKYKIIEVFNNDAVHFNGFAKI